MGASYKNFWSLNTDEAVVTGILRAHRSKDIEVFFPANAQMKGIDLALINIKNKKVFTIQVKGSRGYEPSNKEKDKYGEGSPGWFYFNKDVVHKSCADYFIFLIYVLEEEKNKGRRSLVPHTITIPTSVLKRISLSHKKIGKGNMYNYFIWVNPKKKESIEFRDKEYSLAKYLDTSGFELIYKKLK